MLPLPRSVLKGPKQKIFASYSVVTLFAACRAYYIVRRKIKREWFDTIENELTILEHKICTHLKQ
jgi:hypothetical protein